MDNNNNKRVGNKNNKIINDALSNPTAKNSKQASNIKGVLPRVNNIKTATDNVVTQSSVHPESRDDSVTHATTSNIDVDSTVVIKNDHLIPPHIEDFVNPSTIHDSPVTQQMVNNNQYTNTTPQLDILDLRPDHAFIDHFWNPVLAHNFNSQNQNDDSP